jgi:hypothetical protein
VKKLVTGRKTDAMRATIYSINSEWSIVRKCLYRHAHVSADSVSTVYCGSKRNLKIKEISSS